MKPSEVSMPTDKSVLVNRRFEANETNARMLVQEKELRFLRVGQSFWGTLRSNITSEIMQQV